MTKRNSKGNGTFMRVSAGWQYRLWIEMPDGTRKRKAVTAKTQPACRKKMQQYIDSLSAPPAPTYQTLAELGDIWLENRRGTVVYGTWNNYNLYWNHHIKPALGALQVHQIIPLQIEQFLSEKSNLSYSAQKAIRGVLSQIFRTAIRNDLITKNPMDAIEPLKRPDPDIQIFRSDEVHTIIRHASEDAFGLIVLAMLYTGCRYEEIAALMWSDINTDTITIQRAVVRAENGGWEIRNTTKSGHARIIGINADLRFLLDSLPHRAQYLFPREDGSFMGYDYFYYHYSRFLSAAGVRYLSPHKCRHTYATQLLRGCSDLRVVQQALGHSASSVTELYTHPDAADQIAAAKRLSY